MSREVILRIRPGESVEDFIRRVAETAPPPPQDLVDRLRALLPVGTRPAETIRRRTSAEQQAA